MPLQSLEDYITAQLSALHLEIPADDVEYIARLVEEEEIEEQDKKDGVKGMLEGHGSEAVDESNLDDSVGKMISHWQDMKAEIEAAKDEEGSDDGSESDGEEVVGSKAAQDRALIDSLTPEELAAAQKRALLAQYGYVEDEGAVSGSRDNGAPPVGESLRKREEEKAAAERRAMIDKAIKEDGMRKSKKKKLREREGRDLWAPNLNKAKVDAKAAMAREAARTGAQIKKDRDKAALEKQKADQAKAKLEKQKKAAKGERRA